MIKQLTIAATVATTFILCCGCEKTKPAKTIECTPRELGESFLRAWQDEDVQTLQELLSEDYQHEEQPKRGKDRAKWFLRDSSHWKSKDYEISFCGTVKEYTSYIKGSWFKEFNAVREKFGISDEDRVTEFKVSDDRRNRVILFWKETSPSQWRVYFSVK